MVLKSQPFVVGNPEYRIKLNLVIHIIIKFYFNIGFKDMKQSAYDPKEGCNPPVEMLINTAFKTQLTFLGNPFWKGPGLKFCQPPC